MRLSLFIGGDLTLEKGKSRISPAEARYESPPEAVLRYVLCMYYRSLRNGKTRSGNETGDENH